MSVRTNHGVFVTTFVENDIPRVGEALRMKLVLDDERVYRTRYVRTLPSSGGKGRWLIGERSESPCEDTATGSSLFLFECDDDAWRTAASALTRGNAANETHRRLAVNMVRSHESIYKTRSARCVAAQARAESEGKKISRFRLPFVIGGWIDQSLTFYLAMHFSLSQRQRRFY